LCLSTTLARKRLGWLAGGSLWKFLECSDVQLFGAQFDFSAEFPPRWPAEPRQKWANTVAGGRIAVGERVARRQNRVTRLTREGKITKFRNAFAPKKPFSRARGRHSTVAPKPTPRRPYPPATAEPCNRKSTSRRIGWCRPIADCEQARTTKPGRTQASQGEYWWCHDTVRSGTNTPCLKGGQRSCF